MKTLTTIYNWAHFFSERFCPHIMILLFLGIGNILKFRSGNPEFFIISTIPDQSSVIIIILHFSLRVVLRCGCSVLHSGFASILVALSRILISEPKKYFDERKYSKVKVVRVFRIGTIFVK